MRKHSRKAARARICCRAPFRDGIRDPLDFNRHPVSGRCRNFLHTRTTIRFEAFGCAPPKRILMQQRPLTESRFLAIALTCAASFLFAFLDTSAKYLVTVAHVPILEIIWVRFVVNALLIVAMLGPNAALRALPSNKLMNQLLRSVFLIGATAFNFLALQYLQLDQTATIFFLSPFIVAALAGPMLGEWIGWHRLLAICVGFTGVLFVTRPGFGGIHWAVSFSLLATLSYALYILWTRYLARFDNASTTLVYTPLAGAVFVAPFALANWQMPATRVGLVRSPEYGVVRRIWALACHPCV